MRAIHVANYGTERIYYLVDKEQDHDGVIVRPKQEPVFTDLWSYITRVSGDVGWRKITNTRFHHFFWFGQNGELAKRWRRVFQEHSIEPRKELLLSVPIVTDFPRNEKRKRATEKRSNRAIEFKTLTAAGLHEKALGRRIGRGGSRVARRMMRSADFDPNPIDADLDMLVQEGTLWERPATPGAPHVPGVSGRRMERRARSEGLASERGFASEREPGWDWRSVAKEIDIDPERRMNGTAEQLRTYRLQKFKAVEDHFNDGAPITGRKHAKELVASAHIGFREGTSRADFLGDRFHPEGDTSEGDRLTPVQQELVYALLHELLANPNLQDADFNFINYRTRATVPGLIFPDGAERQQGFAHYWPGSTVVVGEDGLPTIEPSVRRMGPGDDTGPLIARGRRLQSSSKPMIDIGYRDTAPEVDGWRDHNYAVDSGFDPRARPIRPLGQGSRVEAREDAMTARAFYTIMDELNTEEMKAADGWEEDPDDNFRTPDSRTGEMRPTKRDYRVRKQYEEASTYAAGIDMHVQMSKAAHQLAMRKLLMKALEERVEAASPPAPVTVDVPGPGSPDADVVAWMRQTLKASEIRTLGASDPPLLTFDRAMNKVRRAFGISDQEEIGGRKMPKGGGLWDQEEGYERLLQVVDLAEHELQIQGPGLSEYGDLAESPPSVDTSPEQLPIQQLYKWIATESVAAMSPRQQRRALREVAVANITPKLEELNALIQLIESQSDAQFLGAVDEPPSPGEPPTIVNRDLYDSAMANKFALREWLGEPIAGANGQGIKITKEIADFINSDIGFRLRVNETSPDPKVSVGDNLTRGHVMAIFGTRAAYLRRPGRGAPHGVPLGGITTAHMGTMSIQPVPIWALPGFVHQTSPSAYGGIQAAPLSGRNLVDITQVLTLEPDDGDSEAEERILGTAIALRSDALGTMLRDGTPAIQTFGIGHHLAGTPLQYQDPDTNEILTSGPTLVPALSAESVALLVDGLAHVVGQVPNDYLDLGDADPAGVQLGERMSEIAIDAPSHIMGANGENLIPFIGSNPSEDEVTSQLQDEVEGTMKHAIRSIPSLGAQQDAAQAVAEESGALEYGPPGERIGDPREIMPPLMQELVESTIGEPPDTLSTLLELSIGSNLFHFNELDDDERDAMFDLIDHLTFEGELVPLDSAGRPDRDEAQLARDAREFRDVLRAAGMDPSEEGAPSSQRKVTWTSHMGLKQNDNLPPWMRPMGYETPNFLAELMTAHLMGGIIHAEITEFQLGVLRKLTKWLKEKQQFTAKVNLIETPDHIPEAWTDDD